MVRTARMACSGLKGSFRATPGPEVRPAGGDIDRFGFFGSHAAFAPNAC